MNIMKELKKEQRIKELMCFVVSFLEDMCEDNTNDKALIMLKDDIFCAMENYNFDANGEEVRTEEFEKEFQKLEEETGDESSNV